MKSPLLTLSCSLMILAGCSAQVSVQPTGPSSAQPGRPTLTPASDGSGSTTLPSATPASPASSAPASSVPVAVPAIPQGQLVANMGFQQPIASLSLAGTYEAMGLSKASDRFGRPDQALSMSGDGSYLKLKTLDINPEVMPQMSMGIWARYTGTDTENSFQVISHDDGQYDRSLGLDKRTGDWGWSMFTGDTEGFIIGGAPVEAGTWVFLTATYDQISHHSVLYVNGRKYKEGPNTSGSGFPFLMLGANPGYGENFKGEVDDFYLYKRVLSEAEVAQLYEVSKAYPQ